METINQGSAENATPPTLVGSPTLTLWEARLWHVLVVVHGSLGEGCKGFDSLSQPHLIANICQGGSHRLAGLLCAILLCKGGAVQVTY